MSVKGTAKKTKRQSSSAGSKKTAARAKAKPAASKAGKTVKKATPAKKAVKKTVKKAESGTAKKKFPATAGSSSKVQKKSTKRASAKKQPKKTAKSTKPASKVKKTSKRTVSAQPKTTAKKVPAKKTRAKPVKAKTAAASKKQTGVKAGVRKPKISEEKKKTAKETKAKIVKPTPGVKKPRKKPAVKPAAAKASTTKKIGRKKVASPAQKKRTVAKQKETSFISKAIKETPVTVETGKPPEIEPADEMKKEGPLAAHEPPGKIVYYEEGGEKVSREIPGIGLPEEYGENELLVMAVDPATVFVSWEIRKDTFSKSEGVPTLRIYDITGIDIAGVVYHKFTDINIYSRVGSEFFEIDMNGKDIVVEIGFVGKEKKFAAIARSNVIAVPRLIEADELGIADKLSGAGVPFGY
jgi:hypothetical protein